MDYKDKYLKYKKKYLELQNQLGGCRKMTGGNHSSGPDCSECSQKHKMGRFDKKISKFVYFYSDIYEFYNQHIKENLNNIFDIDGIKIDDLNTKKKHTFKGGVSIKIELIIKKIKENIGKHIIFTDATIFINKNKKHDLLNFFNNYLSYDICFADNLNHSYHTYNIGIILIHCTSKILIFFENVLDTLIKTRDWDQKVINNLIKKEKNLKIGKFPKNKIYCNYHFDETLKDDFLIFKSFIHHQNNIINNYNQRIEIFKKGNLISEDEYNLLIKK